MQAIIRPIFRRPTHRLPLRFMLLLALALLVTPSVVQADEIGAIPGPDLFFEANVGQFPETVSYVARGERALFGGGDHYWRYPKDFSRSISAASLSAESSGAS